jgi:hypothetical protein
MRNDQRGWPMAVALLTAALTLVAGCTSAANNGSTSPAPSSARSTGPKTAPASATAGPVTVSLPVIGCPTSLGAAHAAVSLPATRPVAVPRALAARLSLYADDQGIMEVIGPKGWSCAASYGADGSGGISVYPPGETVPQSGTAGAALTPTSATTAIVGSESSACYGCTLYQACPLFSSAAQALRSAFGHACPARPAAEKVVPIGPGIMSFQDPPGVKGDGVPSGGRYPANGVMTYHPAAPDGSWQETCTLPAGDTAECTAILNTFLSWYGQR